MTTVFQQTSEMGAKAQGSTAVPTVIKRKLRLQLRLLEESSLPDEDANSV